jgi:hypothetical protein
MRNLTEQDINRIVKKILSEQKSTEIMGTTVKIDNNLDSKIYVGDFIYWVTARPCNVFDKNDCESFENTHMVSFTNKNDGGVEIKTKKNTITLSKGQVENLFNKLIKGDNVVVHKDSYFGVPYEVKFQR